MFNFLFVVLTLPSLQIEVAMVVEAAAAVASVREASQVETPMGLVAAEWAAADLEVVEEEVGLAVVIEEDQTVEVASATVAVRTAMEEAAPEEAVHVEALVEVEIFLVKMGREVEIA